MHIGAIRRFLLDRGLLWFYVLFIAGFFLLPMAAGHRRLYYLTLMPAALFLWRDLIGFYRNNLLAALILVYAGYSFCSLAWTSGIALAPALWVIWTGLATLSFCLLTGYVWVSYPVQLPLLLQRCIWLAAVAALVSIVSWYSVHPFPVSRLQPLGVMHQENKSACAYGLFFLLAMYALLSVRERRQLVLNALAALSLLTLVLLTQSRTALLATSLALLVLAGWKAGVLILTCVVANVLLLGLDPGLWRARVEGLSFRPGIWQGLLDNMEGHWWIGHGYLSDTVVAAYHRTFDHAHNSYLAALRDGGVVGLGLLLAVLCLAVFWAYRLNSRCGRPSRIYLALVVYGAIAVFSDFDRLFVQPKEIWLFFWGPVAIVMAVFPAIWSRSGVPVTANSIPLPGIQGGLETGESPSRSGVDVPLRPHSGERTESATSPGSPSRGRL